MKTNTLALIVAAGSGSRMEGTIPKQYRLLAGQPVLRRSVAAFLNHPGIDEVLVVIHPDHTEYYQDAVKGLDLPKPAIGGAERQDSVRLGAEHAAKHFAPTHILVHDAARCMVDADTISHVLRGLKKSPAVIPTLPVRDTIKRVENGKVECTIPRASLHNVQTPQGFDSKILLDLHQHFAGKMYTDDASLAEAGGITVSCVPGQDSNFKLTTAQDWELASMMLSASLETRTGMGYDVHRLVPFDDAVAAKERKVWLCGVGIPHSHKLDGHSDADVGLHALVDAMLGTIGAGDIGQHFPPSDPKWKGADSSAFVKHANHLLAQAGARLVHADITLICESPKVSPHREAMRKRVAELLGCDIDAVSIKATTTEGLGFAGRSEGIAAQAVATVEKPRKEAA